MKKSFVLFVTLALFSVGSAFAAIGKSIADLNKTITIAIDGTTYKGGFLLAEKNAAYYLVLEDFGALKVKVSRDSLEKDYGLTLILNDSLIEFKAPGKSSANTYSASSIEIKDTKPIDNSIGIEYWSTYKTTGSRSTTKVELKSNLESSNSISAPVTVTGTMSFSPCDGCEHSDQLIVQGNGIAVNVINLKFGSYYEEDCGGTIQRLLSRLLEEDEVNGDYAPGLKVPFTYVGTIDANVGDYRDSIDDFWMAQEGQLYIGKTKLPVTRFLDSLVYQVAATLKVKAKDIWKDVMETGVFTKYAKNSLSFIYKNVEVKTDLETGKSTVKKY